MSTPLPPHLHGVMCKESAVSKNFIVRPAHTSSSFTSFPIEQLWDDFNEQDRHDLMMIALVDPAGLGSGILPVAERGRFKLYNDGEIWGCL